jgi:hypothetical protein
MRRERLNTMRAELDLQRDFQQIEAEMRALWAPKPEPGDEPDATGLGAPAAAVEPPKPEDALPFNVVDIPGTGVGGKPGYKYAVDKETGDIHWKGAVFSNMEHLQPLAEKALNAFGDLVKHIAQNAGMAEQQHAPGVGRAPVQQLPQETNGAAQAEGSWSDS